MSPTSSGWAKARWSPGGVQTRYPARGGQTCPRLTIELLSEEREEDSEVDGTLPLLQHGVQLLFWDTHLPWWAWGMRWTRTHGVPSRAQATLPSFPTLGGRESEATVGGELQQAGREV